SLSAARRCSRTSPAAMVVDGGARASHSMKPARPGVIRTRRVWGYVGEFPPFLSQRQNKGGGLKILRARNVPCFVRSAFRSPGTRCYAMWCCTNVEVLAMHERTGGFHSPTQPRCRSPAEHSLGAPPLEHRPVYIDRGGVP